ncbi:MAG: hypothetical protein WB992_17825 [Bryobacteraceae bacterium]
MPEMPVSGLVELLSLTGAAAAALTVRALETSKATPINANGIARSVRLDISSLVALDFLDRKTPKATNPTPISSQLAGSGTVDFPDVAVISAKSPSIRSGLSVSVTEKVGDTVMLEPLFSIRVVAVNMPERVIDFTGSVLTLNMSSQSYDPPPAEVKYPLAGPNVSDVPPTNLQLNSGSKNLPD